MTALCELFLVSLIQESDPESHHCITKKVTIIQLEALFFPKVGNHLLGGS